MTGAPAFPAQLIERNQWCLWRIEPGKDGRPTKVPYRPDGRKASSSNPKTWSSFDAVGDILRRQPGSYRGPGFFFAEDDSICGVDVDVGLNGHGSPQPWASEIVARFDNTYRALSVSGCGLHILCRATLPGKGRNFYVPEAPSSGDGKKAQIGVFDRRRFFALTGEVYGQSLLALADHQETVDWLLGLMQPRVWTAPVNHPPRSAAGELTDVEILERARGAKNGAKFAKLWTGDCGGVYSSPSEADLALCCLLAFWCGPDPERIDRLFRQSALAREKWLEREDYRQSTIQRAIEKTKEYYKPKKNGRIAAPVAGEPPAPGTRPEVWIGARELQDMTAEALVGLQRANDPPQLFSRSGCIVAVVADERDRLVISNVSESAIRGRMARSAFYFKREGKGDDEKHIPCIPPKDVVRDVMSRPPREWKFPPLEAIIEAPCMRPDGSICDVPGYDPATGLFYSPAPRLEVPEIASSPMRDHVEAALATLDSAIGEFPFVDATSKANAIASILTPLVRPGIEGPTPLALYDAPQAGTGKSLLAEVAAIVTTGRPAETFSAPHDDEEWRKKITTALATGGSIVLIDNVIQRLDSDALCMALTSLTVADRVMRTHEKIVLPVRCAWFATGNNIQLGGDMPRRCYWIRLDAQTSQPYRRTGFQHPNLRRWVTEHRGELIAAALTIARYWFVQGRPAPTSVRPMGSFEGWCETVGGMLEAAGVEGFLANADLMMKQADKEGRQWECFLLTLAEIFHEELFRAANVFEKLSPADDLYGDAGCAERLREVLPDTLSEAADRPGRYFQRRLGRCFSDRVDKRFGESQVFVQRAGEDSKTKVQLWRVVTP